MVMNILVVDRHTCLPVYLLTGDGMCQQAMQSLKSAAKANSHHKQKIIIRITINGVALLDAVANVSCILVKVVFCVLK